MFGIFEWCVAVRFVRLRKHRLGPARRGTSRFGLFFACLVNFFVAS